MQDSRGNGAPLCSESIERKCAVLLRVLGGYMHNGGNHLSSVPVLSDAGVE